MHYTVPSTGEVVKVYLFVATLPFSQYSYVEATKDMKMDTWIDCNRHMFEYFGGSTVRVVCDNLKTGVVMHPEYSDTGRPLVTVEKSTQYAGQVHLTKKLNTVGSPQLI